MEIRKIERNNIGIRKIQVINSNTARKYFNIKNAKFMLTHVFFVTGILCNFQSGFHRKNFKNFTEAQQHFVRDSENKFNNKFKNEQK